MTDDGVYSMLIYVELYKDIKLDNYETILNTISVVPGVKKWIPQILFLACKHGSHRVIHSLMIKFNVDLNQTDKDGNSALHYIAMSENDSDVIGESVWALLRHCSLDTIANLVKLKNKGGRTAGELASHDSDKSRVFESTVNRVIEIKSREEYDSD